MGKGLNMLAATYAMQALSAVLGTVAAILLWIEVRDGRNTIATIISAVVVALNICVFLTQFYIREMLK
jgi:uncharacterized membrane protein